MPAIPLTDALAQVRSLLLDGDRFVRAVAGGQQRGAAVPYRRVELRPVKLKSGTRLQVVAYDERQAHTSNAAWGAEAERAVDGLLGLGFGNWHVETTAATLQLRVTKKGEALLHKGPPPAAAPSLEHNKAKARLLDPADRFWRVVGIADADGRIKPTRQDKFRQVEEFVRALDAVLKTVDLPTGRPLRVVDLGCGNAYLTFAAYRFLTHVRGLGVELVGVDTKQQAHDRNTALAAELGWEGMRFIQGAIAGAPVDGADVVLALHACDTATDDALARAVSWKAPVVLAAPCCHHDLQAQIRQATAPSPYGMVTRHGILRERFADVLTDALRASLMRQAGYRVEVVEFIASEHTPRNTLLRAVHTAAPADAAVVEEYRAMVEAWGVKPRLAELLGGARAALAGVGAEAGF